MVRKEEVSRRAGRQTCTALPDPNQVCLKKRSRSGFSSSSKLDSPSFTSGFCSRSLVKQHNLHCLRGFVLDLIMIPQCSTERHTQRAFAGHGGSTLFLSDQGVRAAAVVEVDCSAGKRTRSWRAKVKRAFNCC